MKGIFFRTFKDKLTFFEVRCPAVFGGCKKHSSYFFLFGNEWTMSLLKHLKPDEFQMSQ